MARIHSNVPLIMKLRQVGIAEMIEKTGMDRLTIRKSRKGKLMGSCRLASLYKIAQVLDVELDWLFCIIENEDD